MPLAASDALGPSNAAQASVDTAQSSVDDDSLLIGLALSGGGMRAAAFSYGVLSQLDRTHFPTITRDRSLLDRVDYVSGVSGGAVTAAYFGLKGRAALGDFRQRFLLRDAEEALRTPLNPLNVLKAYEGGLNDTEFSTWLNQNLFDNATFEAIGNQHRPEVLINASYVYNRTPFVLMRRPFRQSAVS